MHLPGYLISRTGKCTSWVPDFTPPMHCPPPLPPHRLLQERRPPASTPRSRHWPIVHSIICSIGQFATPRQLRTIWTRARRQGRGGTVANCTICSSDTPVSSGERRPHRKPTKACEKGYSAGAATPRSRRFWRVPQDAMPRPLFFLPRPPVGRGVATRGLDFAVQKSHPPGDWISRSRNHTLPGLDFAVQKSHPPGDWNQDL